MSLDVRTTEYVSNTQIASSVQSSSKTSAPNSVMTEANKANTSVEKKENTSKLDELLEKLCAELSKYGLKPEELKNSGILFRITGMNEKQIEAASEGDLKQIINCLKTAIKDTAKDGKVDLEKVGKTANDYYVAIKTGWSIEGFKKHNNAVKKSSLFERLKETDTTGALKKYNSLEEVPENVLEDCIDKFFNDTLFEEQLKKANQIKDENVREKKIESIKKAQLQTFGRILVNTPDEEKGVFKKVLSSLVASNRIKGLDAVLASFDTPTARTAWADSWSTDEIEKLGTKADIEGNVPSKEDVEASTAKITGVSSKEAVESRHEEYTKDAKAFFEKNKDILAEVAEKEAKGIKLTDEEKQIKLERDNYYKAFAAGEMVGTATNEIITEEAKEELLGTMNKDAYELPIYKEVLEDVNKLIEEHPEILTMPKEEVVKLLDEATNGNYSTVAAGNREELKAPVDKTKSEETAETPDYGFSQDTSAPDTAKLEAAKAQVYSTMEDTETKFTVDKTIKVEEETKLTTSETNELKSQAFRSAANITTYLKEAGESKFGFATEVFKKFGNMGSTTQDWAMNYFSNASSAVQNLFLNGIASSVEGMIAAAKEVDLSKFNLIGVSVTTQKQIDKIQEQKV